MLPAAVRDLARLLLDQIAGLADASYVEFARETARWSGRSGEVVERDGIVLFAALLRLRTLEGLDEYWFDMHRLRKQTERTFLVHRQQLFRELEPAEAFESLQTADQLHEAARSMTALAHEVGRISISEA